MAAIVRVKRRRSEEPVESLLFSCKRRKESTNEQPPEVSGLLKFAGTVPCEDTNVSSYIREAIKKDKLKKEYKSHSLNYDTRTGRQRQQQKQQSQSNRYKVIASRRAALLDRLDSLEETQGATAGSRQEETKHDVNQMENGVISPSTSGSQASNGDPRDTNSQDVSQKVFCLYDVEEETVTNYSNNSATSTNSSEYSSITCNNVPMIREVVPVDNSQVSNDYVYDLYYTNSREIDFRVLEDMLTVEAFGDEMVFADSRADEEEYLEVYDDEDDSNDEGNWRNDYPEEDPYFIENQEEEYYYGDDDVGHHRYDTEDPLANFMAASCNIREPEVVEPEQDERVCDVISEPQRSYESYYRAMLHDLRDEADDSDDDFDVR